jgi:phage FluMu protein Com
MGPPESAASEVTRRVRWLEMRCVRCAHLLQKVEEEALRPGKRLEVKCGRCKVINYLVGGHPMAVLPGSAAPRTRTG